MQNWQPRRDVSDHKDDASRSWTTLPQWHCWVASTLFSWGFAIRSEPSAFNVTLILVEFRTKKQPERNPGELLHRAQHVSSPLNYLCWILASSAESQKAILDSK